MFYLLKAFRCALRVWCTGWAKNTLYRPISRKKKFTQHSSRCTTSWKM